MRPEDEVKPGKAPRAKDGPAPLSEKLVAELTASKTMALRAALGDNPDVALTAVTHALGLPACFRGAAGQTCIDVQARSPNLTAILPVIGTSVTAQAVDKRHEGLLAALPEDPAALWDHLARGTVESRLLRSWRIVWPSPLMPCSGPVSFQVNPRMPISLRARLASTWPCAGDRHPQIISGGCRRTAFWKRWRKAYQRKRPRIYRP